MNTPTFLLTFACTVGAATILTGCKTTGVERAEETRGTLQTIEADIANTRTQVETTNATLQSMLSPDADVQKVYQTFSQQVGQTNQASERLLAQLERVTVQGAEYFSEWRQQGETYSNPQIRAVSEERRAELTAVFNRISEASVGVRGALQSYVSDVRDLNTFLSNDLTPRGLSALRPAIENAIRDGERFRTSVQPVLAAVTQARNRMAPGSIPATE